MTPNEYRVYLQAVIYFAQYTDNEWLSINDVDPMGVIVLREMVREFNAAQGLTSEPRIVPITEEQRKIKDLEQRVHLAEAANRSLIRIVLGIKTPIEQGKHMRLITPAGDEYRVTDAATIGPPTIVGAMYCLNATLERDGEYWPGIHAVYGCTLEIADFRQRDVEMHIRGFRLMGEDKSKLVYFVLLKWRTDL